MHNQYSTIPLGIGQLVTYLLGFHSNNLNTHYDVKNGQKNQRNRAKNWEKFCKAGRQPISRIIYTCHFSTYGCKTSQSNDVQAIP